MLLTKTPITQLKSRQYGAGVATPFNFNTFAKRMKKAWVVIFAISVTQNRVTALQRKASK
jgi:hypothetical protein